MDWLPVTDEQKDGQRYRLGHELDLSSMKVDSICPIYGSYENGGWKINAFFTYPALVRGMAQISAEPTHYYPGSPA